MKVRPTSVTVIALFLSVTGVIALFVSGLLLYRGHSLVPPGPLPAPLWHFMMFAGLLLTIVSGIGMLKGQNWARLLYVAWTGIDILAILAISPMSLGMIAKVGVFLLTVFFLFRPKANKYFRATEPANGSQDAYPTPQEPQPSLSCPPLIASTVRGRWLVFVSLILTIHVEILVDGDIAARAFLKKDIPFYLMAKLICLTVILFPLLPYLWLNGRRGIKAAWGGMLAIGIVIALRLASDVVCMVMLFSR